MLAQDQLEHSVREMRGQFRAVSGQIADELNRLAQHVAAAPPAVRGQVITAAAQIAATQEILRAASDRLPPDPQEAHAIMDSVLQAQQGALHQLVLIVRQHAPGWYPNLSAWQQPASPNPAGGWPANFPIATAWPPSLAAPATDANAPAWPSGQPAVPGEDPNQQTAPTSWYPSPPTVQELATHGWPQSNGNGYDVQPPSPSPAWPAGASSGALVPYVNGAFSEAPVSGPWPGRRSYALFPAPYQPYQPYHQPYASVEYSQPRGYAPTARQINNGHTFATARRRAELVHGANTRHLFWLGIAAAGLIFAYATFPWEIRRLDAVADQKTAVQDVEERVPPRVDPAARPRVMATPQAAPVPTLIARAPDEEPPQSSGPQLGGSASGMMPPGSGLMVGTPGSAMGVLWPPQAGPPPVTREPPPVEAMVAPVEQAPPPAARTKQRAAPSRVEQELAAAEVATRGERFVPVLFTHQDQPTTAQAFGELQQQFPQLLAGRKGQTQSIDLGKKGVWHRLVVLPAGSRQDADNFCGQLMGAGYEKCWVKPY